MIYCNDPRDRVEPGQLVATQGVMQLCETIEGFTERLAHAYYEKYLKGIWGELCEEDKEANENALKYGHRILAEYVVCKRRVWMITEWDRSATTILLPEEY